MSRSSEEAKLTTAKEELAAAEQKLAAAEQKLVASKQELAAAEQKQDEDMKGIAKRQVLTALEGVETAQHAVTAWTNSVIRLSSGNDFISL
jgi:hypothetical protein